MLCYGNSVNSSGTAARMYVFRNGNLLYMPCRQLSLRELNHWALPMLVGASVIK